MQTATIDYVVYHFQWEMSYCLDLLYKEMRTAQFFKGNSAHQCGKTADAVYAGGCALC
jgi:hypothetical protein